ncbi:MAG: hypothetical protein AAFV95_07655 [Bacteroidota bacterium]
MRIDKEVVTEQIRAIIDARIQYIDYQTNQIVSSITGIDIQQAKPDLSVRELNQFNFAYNNCDSFLTAMEEFSKAKRLLLVLRTHLDPINGSRILDLLQDQKYIHMSKKELVQCLEAFPEKASHSNGLPMGSTR